MSNRTIERAVARRLYVNFSRSWRSQKRLTGKYGQPGHRKPTFSQWYAMHQRDQEMMAQSTPQDVQEYLGLDPWTEADPADVAAKMLSEHLDGDDRGVTTIPIAGDE